MTHIAMVFVPWHAKVHCRNILCVVIEPAIQTRLY